AGRSSPSRTAWRSACGPGSSRETASVCGPDAEPGELLVQLRNRLRHRNADVDRLRNPLHPLGARLVESGEIVRRVLSGLELFERLHAAVGLGPHHGRKIVARIPKLLPAPVPPTPPHLP